MKRFTLTHPQDESEEVARLDLLGANWSVRDDNFGGEATMPYTVEGGDMDGQEMVLVVQWGRAWGNAKYAGRRAAMRRAAAKHAETKADRLAEDADEEA
jgi:hypothetical protein